MAEAAPAVFNRLVFDWRVGLPLLGTTSASHEAHRRRVPLHCVRCFTVWVNDRKFEVVGVQRANLAAVEAVVTCFLSLPLNL